MRMQRYKLFLKVPNLKCHITLKSPANLYAGDYSFPQRKVWVRSEESQRYLSLSRSYVFVEGGADGTLTGI